MSGKASPICGQFPPPPWKAWVTGKSVEANTAKPHRGRVLTEKSTADACSGCSSKRRREGTGKTLPGFSGLHDRRPSKGPDSPGANRRLHRRCYKNTDGFALVRQVTIRCLPCVCIHHAVRNGVFDPQPKAQAFALMASNLQTPGPSAAGQTKPYLHPCDV